MKAVFAKSLGIWLVFVVVAVGNGVAREQYIAPLLGESLAIPVSGITLSVLIFVISFFLIPHLEVFSSRTYFAVGLFWVLLTLGFESLFGAFVLEKSWHEIYQVLNVKSGNLFILVLLSSAISPWLVAKLRGLV